MPSIDISVLGGLPVTIEFDWESADPSVGIMSGGAANWAVTHIAGKRCKKSPDWLHKRIEANPKEVARIETECNAWEPPEFDDPHDWD